jgi:hypothetical protein
MVIPHPVDLHLVGISLHRKKTILARSSLVKLSLSKKSKKVFGWLAFINYDFGYIDLEEGSLQPLDNPFGPKVLPM